MEDNTTTTPTEESKITILLRSLLTAAGAYLLGSNVFGHEVNESLWQEFTGVAMGIAGIIWSIKSKELGIEQLQGAVRQTLTFIFGFLVPAGIVTEKLAVFIITVVGLLLPTLQSFVSKEKAKQIKEGEISKYALKSTK